MKLINILLYIWQLPQNLLGLLIIKITKANIVDVLEASSIYRCKSNFGVSLGKYIILGEKFLYQPFTILHEYGHCRQSLYLGWFYLLIVGIPSFAMNILSRIFKGKFAQNYYNRFPENWADKIVGIKRK